MAPHYIFFLLTGITLLFGLALTLCYIPIGKKKKQMLEESFEDPFRRSLIAAAILAQIDDELVADEVLLPPQDRDMLEKFRQRVRTCHSMTGIHGIIEDSADLIKLLKESGKKLQVESPVNQVRMNSVREERIISVRMQEDV